MTLYLKAFIIHNMQVGIGISTTQGYIKAAKEAVEKAKAGLPGANIDLALVFSTDEFGHPLMLKTIADTIGRVPLIGASSTAVISRQGVFKHGLVVILFSLAQGSYFNAACAKDLVKKTALNTGKELGEQLLSGGKNVRRNFSVVFSDLNLIDAPNLVVGLQEKLGKSFPLVGASIPSIVNRKKNCLYYKDQVLSDACCGMLCGGKINFGLGMEHGWQPLGKPRYVTKASGNIVNEIDSAPAVNLYKEYFAKDATQLKKEMPRLNAFYPLGIGVTGQKEYLLRSVMSILEDGSLLFHGDIPEGSLIRLMIGSKESCLSSARKATETATRSIDKKKIKFALILSSLSRYTLLGRHAGLEIKAIRDVLGEDTPLAGIYSSAEQGPMSSVDYLGRAYIHNNSITVLTIAD